MQQKDKFSSVMTLPSGREISLDRPDFAVVKSSEDFLELRCALMEKVIDIELQIDLFKSGCKDYLTDDPSWLPRATAAMKWAKLYRDECQNRAGRFNEIERLSDRKRREAKFVDAARDILPATQFREIAILSGLFDPMERAA